MKNRLEALKKRLGTSWGEVAAYIGISRAMLDFIRTGKRDPGNKTLELVEEAERRCGIIPPPDIPTDVGTSAEVGATLLERIANSLERIATALEKLMAHQETAK